MLELLQAIELNPRCPSHNIWSLFLLLFIDFSFFSPLLLFCSLSLGFPLPPVSCSAGPPQVSQGRSHALYNNQPCSISLRSTTGSVSFHALSPFWPGEIKPAVSYQHRLPRQKKPKRETKKEKADPSLDFWFDSGRAVESTSQGAGSTGSAASELQPKSFSYFSIPSLLTE
ncbi:uncharacterized protein ARB_07067 [Trichophyton benhamiae CBS 112371]|uniref:Uncharacterized protein n=1 Tax=Arthroderma benhamiae (strain ATCC MYA-4681 / CBS 112371) TaxID=663331 RepID=D4AS52_ARTBC|nr:uncharacterized protein ARB_07067 [Trichophyton benhamiae CBS 112371]EFE34116.1 hypothetical protein ARB_07067 [Trichophyton benhamiae CBS 112371]